MVSKVAVIALVAIVACPILLGYALNLDEVTHTRFVENKDPVIVSQMLQNGYGYNYVHADQYELNTKFYQNGSRILPWFEEINDVKSTYRMEQFTQSAGQYPTYSTSLSNFNYYFIQSNYAGTGGYLSVNIVNTSNTVVHTVHCLKTFYWDASTQTVSYNYYPTPGNMTTASGSYSVPDPAYKYAFFTEGGAYTATAYVERLYTSLLSARYIDLSAGFHFVNVTQLTNSAKIDLPPNPRNVLITFDLNTITASSAAFYIATMDGDKDTLRFEKITDGDGPHWTVYNNYTNEKITDLYYDSSLTSNTYQLAMDVNGGQIRYVGAWPTMVGAANYYQNYSFDWWYTTGIDNIGDVYFYGDSPIMRIDDSEYKAFEYPVIENNTYEPIRFRNNPKTTISAINQMGTSIDFGGNTYIVKEGYITIGSKQVPVKDLKLESVFNENSYYDNKINGTIISTTIAPSAITFNGKWSATITTVSQTSETYTETEWVAGSFAWGGMDQNFLIIGLLTSLGAFIALGIYIRRTKASLWPLLIVCGGAAVLFFIML